MRARGKHRSGAVLDMVIDNERVQTSDYRTYTMQKGFSQSVQDLYTHSCRAMECTREFDRPQHHSKVHNVALTQLWCYSVLLEMKMPED